MGSIFQARMTNLFVISEESLNWHIEIILNYDNQIFEFNLD